MSPPARPPRQPRVRQALALAALVHLAFGTGACRRGEASTAPSTAPSAAPLAPTTAAQCPPAGPARPGPLAAIAAEPERPGARGDAALLGAADQQRRVRGLEAMDAGRFDVARQEFAAILARAPGNLAVQALFDAATRALLAAQESAALSFANVVPTPVAAPPWRHTVARAVAIEGAAPAPKLVQVAAQRNSITDDAEWLRENNFRLPELEVPNPMRGLPGELPPNIPPTFGRYLLVQAIAHPDHTILFYGENYHSGRFVAVVDASGRLLAFLDFDAYRMAPDNLREDLQFVDQGAQWAEVKDGVLYISHGHGTYARSSKGMTAYVTALDVATGELRWRSPPLVAGAGNFIVHGGHILTGYGFTAEPDHVIVLDRRDGKVTSKARVASAPQYLFLRDRRLFVRTYDMNYQFDLR